MHDTTGPPLPRQPRSRASAVAVADCPQPLRHIAAAGVAQRQRGPVPSLLQRIPATGEGGVLVATVPDPDEPDGRDPGRHGGSEDTDAAFAGIIADWRAEPDAPRWPADADRIHDGREPVPAKATGPQRQDNRQDTGDEDHFEPSEPPPLPVPRPRTLGGMLLIAIGILLLIRPSVLSLGDMAGTPLGMLAITAGIGWLVLGLRGGPPPDGWDDGARL